MSDDQIRVEPDSSGRYSSADTDTCETCETSELSPVYAIGSVRPAFPSLGVQREYEFERATLQNGGSNEQENLYRVLSSAHHIARMMCWTFDIRSVPSYHLIPRSETELDSLVHAMEPQSDGRRVDTDVVIGWKGPDRECGGVRAPTLILETIYSFDAKVLVSTIAQSVGLKKGELDSFVASAQETFGRISQITGNRGENDLRALNWVAVRFAPLYRTVADAIARDLVLSKVEVRPSRLSAEARRIVDVIISFQSRKLAPSESYFVPVDIADLFPHPLATTVQPFLER